MSKKIIRVRLGVDDINKAIAELGQHKAWIEERTKALTERLAMLGGTVASMRYSQALADGHAEISVEQTPKGYIIHASGEDVCFLEFGTGVGATHPQAQEFGFTPGSYSQSELGKGQFIPNEKEYWYYNGVKYSGQTPASGMYDASKEILEQVYTIAKEVFND